MIYELRIPDLTVHDDTTCGGHPHCKVASSHERWNAAYPIWRTVSTELEACKQIRQRFPDCIPMTSVLPIDGDKVVGMYFIKDEQEMRRAEAMNKRNNPVAIMHVIPETRADRKLIKNKRVFDRQLWFTGYVPELATIMFERELVMRSSLRLGPTTLPLVVGLDADGRHCMQIPGTLNIELTGELLEQLGKLGV